MKEKRTALVFGVVISIFETHGTQGPNLSFFFPEKKRIIESFGCVELILVCCVQFLVDFILPETNSKFAPENCSKYEFSGANC